MILFKIAFRNMREHTSKTLIVGILIALGSFILVTGNSFMDSVTSGLKLTYSENYTGDLIIHGRSKDSFSLMGGMSENGIPVIDDFAGVKKQVGEMEEVAASLPLISGAASVNVDDSAVGFSMLWGVDYAQYRAMFPGNLKLVQGDWPVDAGASIMMSESVWRDAEKEAKRPINIGDKLLLSSMGQNGTKIREVTLRAVFRFERGSEMLDLVSLTDPGTLRALNGMTLLASGTTQAAADATPAVSDAIDENSMFGSGDLTSSVALTGKTPENFNAILGDTSVRDKYAETDSDAWNFLLIRLDGTVDAKAATNSLQQWINKTGAELDVSDWRWGAGMQADLAYYLKTIFNIIVIIIVLIAVIIIMNTLTISITERTPEIGTMRAIGASKPFILAMIMIETLITSIIFGLAGMFTGSVAIAIMNAIGLSSSNQLLGALFGGSVFRPLVSFAALRNAMASVIAIGVVSCLYPIAIALKIQPVRAMQR